MDAAEKARIGALYRLDLDGTPHRIFDGLGIPNTLAWSADSKTMYFAETLDRTIYAFDFDPTTGTPSNRRVFVKYRVPAIRTARPSTKTGTCGTPSGMGGESFATPRTGPSIAWSRCRCNGRQVVCSVDPISAPSS